MVKKNELINSINQAVAMHDYTLAEEYSLELRDEFPENPAVYHLLGTIYTRKGEYVKAIDALQTADRLDPGNAETLNNLAVVYKKSSNINDALKTIKRAYDIDPGNPDICYNIANVYKDLDDPQKAEFFYRKAIELNPHLPLAYNNLGTLLESMGGRNDAISIYQRGLAEDPNHPTLHFNLGIALSKEGRKEEAVIELKKAVRSKPGWVDGLNTLGTLFLEQGKFDEAYHCFKSAFGTDSDNVHVLNNMGVALENLGRYEEAGEYFDKALTIDPYYIEAAVNFGKLQEKIGTGSNAIDIIKRAMKKRGSSSKGLLTLGKLLLTENRFSEAAEVIRELLHRDPENSEGHTLLGILNVKTGKKKKAFSRFCKAVELSSENLEARYQKVLLHHENGEFEESIPDLEYIYAKDPQFRQTKVLLAEAFLHAGKEDKALPLYLDLKVENPDNEEILHKLVYLLKKTGDKESALKTAEDLIVLQEHREDPESTGRMEKSIKIYEEIISDFEKDYEDVISRSIESYLSEVVRLDNVKDKLDDEVLLAADFPDLEGEVVPILDFGGIEPVIEVNEEDREVINLSEMEEILDLPDEDENIENIKASLLQGGGYSPNSFVPPVYQPPPPGSGAGNSVPQSFNGNPLPNYALPWQGQGQGFPPPMPLQVITVPVPQVIIAQSGTKEGETAASGKIVVQYINKDKSPAAENTRGERERDRRKKNEFDPDTKADPSDLFGYLEGLTTYLPEEKRRNFEESEMKLKLEALRAKINGKPGITRIIEKKYRKSDTIDTVTDIPKEKIESTFEFINGLADFLPDKAVGTGIKNKVDHILTMMREDNG